MRKGSLAKWRIAGLAICGFLQIGCGGGDSTPPAPPLGTDATLILLSVSGAALVPEFSPSVTSYAATVSSGRNSVDVFAIPNDGNASFAINGSVNAAVALAAGDTNISIVVTAENGVTTRSYTVVVSHQTIAQEAYIKASNTGSDSFGGHVTLSADGKTLVATAFWEDSAAIGVDGDQTDDSALQSGAVYVFTRDGVGTWMQQAYIKASNTETGDRFGTSLSLSDDGNTLAVGSSEEDSAAIGANGDQTDNSAFASGAVYVFTRDTGGVWTQQAYLKASNSEILDRFGTRMRISGDGNTLAVGTVLEDSAATGVNGDQMDNSASNSGAVYVFTRDTGGVWTQQAFIKASNTEADDFFGISVALSTGGETLVVGARMENSAATGVNGDQMDTSAPGAGAVYVFSRDSGGVWMQQAYIKASNTEAGDFFGESLSMSGDGNTLAVSASKEDSAATGDGGDQMDNSVRDAGAVYVFTRSGGDFWTQQAYIKASNPDESDQFRIVTLSDNGNILAVGTDREASADTGVDGDQTDNSILNAGAVYLFTRDGRDVWTQLAYLKASNTGAQDFFSQDLWLSGDGNTLAVGAKGEDSAATGVDGDQTDNSILNSGAVYVFDLR